MRLKRRDFLKTTVTATAGVYVRAGGKETLPAWSSGRVAHLLPTVSHNRFLIKVSFREALEQAPRLKIAANSFAGRMTDTRGHFFYFDVPGLSPATAYELALVDAKGEELCEPWSLKTFPHPDAPAERFRLLIYTCAGGHGGLKDESGKPLFLPMEQRRQLLLRGLSFAPDAVVAIGDHVYWDLRAGRSAQLMGKTASARSLAGEFNREEPVLGTHNEEVLKKAAGPQITDLYATFSRSTPVFFLQDDHDYFENDEAGPPLVTFPPDTFMLRAARATQSLFYPEFLPDGARPADLPASAAGDRPAGVSESFGTLRYGRLLELLLYDCRRFLTRDGSGATFVPKPVEAWLVERMRSGATRHLVNVPSAPVGWSAGKWAEWYPDVIGENGQLGDASPKYLWQEGWSAQHDRLVEAASGMKGRIPLFLCGDLHCIAEGKMVRSGNVDLGANPLLAIIVGPVSTGPVGWPSAFRRTLPRPPRRLGFEENLAPIEENGFTLVDFTSDGLEVRLFRWRAAQPTSLIDSLEPFRTVHV